LKKRGIMKLVPIISIAFLLIILSCSDRSDQVGSDNVQQEPDSLVTLEVVDSIGIELGDSNYIFGSIRAIDRGPHGEILILDNVKHCILAYSSQGEFIEQIGRYGHGPGEFGSASFFEVLGDGSICVDDENGWLRFDPDWEYIDSREVSSANLMQTVSTGQRQIVGVESIFGNADGNLSVTKNVALWSDSTPGDPDQIYFTHVYPVAEPNDIYVVDFNPMIFTADETHVYIAPEPQTIPLVYVFALNGSPIDTLELNYPEIEKTQQEIEEETAFYETRVLTSTSGEGQVDWEPAPYREMINSLGVDSLGRLWVQRGFELSPSFDVFDPVSFDHLFTASIENRDDAADWQFDISEHGIVAYTEDPVMYYKVYLIE
jgi:hypothetical protein